MFKVVLKHVGVLSLCALSFILGIHTLAADRLLFQSDIYSLLLYLVAMTGLLTFIFSCFSLVIFCIPVTFSHRFIRRCIIGVVVFISCIVCISISFVLPEFIAIYTYYTLLLIGLYFLSINMSRYLESIGCPVWGVCISLCIILPFYIVCYFAMAIIFSLELVSGLCFAATLIGLMAPYFDYDSTKYKLERLGICVLGLVMLSPFCVVLNYHNRNADTFDSDTLPKHLVMIVFDGFPVKLVNSYNVKAPRTELDDIFAQGTLFKNSYTSFPYTPGFFGTFYSGVLCSVEIPCNVSHNIIRQLQDKGVSVKNIAWHRNAIPEASAVHSNTYYGLRSVLLNQDTLVLPEMLGMDYHVKFPNLGNNFCKMLGRRFDLYDRVDKFRGQKFFIDEIKKNTMRSRKSLTIITVKWRGLFHKEWSNYHYSSEALRYFGASLIDWQYDTEGSREQMEHIRHDMRMHMDDLARKLDVFIEAFRKEFQADGMTLLLTSDHGSMFDHGRYNYRWHPQEGAIRTLLSVIDIDDSTQGHIDERYLDTLDIHKGVSEFFGLKVHNKEAISLFSDEERVGPVITLTNPSDHHKEWFLIISGMPEGKYIINLHSEGGGKVALMRVGKDLEESLIKEFTEVPNTISHIISSYITQNGLLDYKNIHSRFNIK